MFRYSVVIRINVVKYMFRYRAGHFSVQNGSFLYVGMPCLMFDPLSIQCTHGQVTL